LPTVPFLLRQEPSNPSLGVPAIVSGRIVPPQDKQGTNFVSLGGTLNFSGAGPNQTPDQIAGLKLWLKADSLALSDGDPVGTWTDSSGTSNDATQATAGFKPLYKTGIINGKPVVRFDGVDDYLAFPVGPTTSSTAFVVAKLNAAPGSQPQYAPFIIFGDSTGGVSGSRICARLAGTNWGSFAFSSEVSSGEDLTNNVPALLEITTTSGSTILYRQGTQKATATDHAAGPGTSQLNWICGEIGATRWLSADIAEIIIYDSVLSTSDRQSIENYLLVKYGFVAGGGTLTKLVLKSVTAAISFAGALTRQVAKSLTGTLSTAGTVTKLALKTVAGTLNFSGALTKLATVLKTLAGTLSFSGGLNKQANKSTGGTLSFAGAITRVVQKTASGVLNFTGTLTKRANKSVTGTLSFSGAVATIVAVLKNLTGTLGFSGGVTRRANKSTGGTLSFSGAITRGISKTVGGAISFTGSLPRLVSKSVGGVLSFIGSVISVLGGEKAIYAIQKLGARLKRAVFGSSLNVNKRGSNLDVEKKE
jgi:hypothetical protein